MSGVQGTSAAKVISGKTASVASSKTFVDNFNAEQTNFNGIPNDLTEQQTALTAAYALNPPKTEDGTLIPVRK